MRFLLVVAPSCCSNDTVVSVGMLGDEQPLQYGGGFSQWCCHCWYVHAHGGGGSVDGGPYHGSHRGGGRGHAFNPAWGLIAITFNNEIQFVCYSWLILTQ